jgi:hypothetical protein
VALVSELSLLLRLKTRTVVPTVIAITIKSAGMKYQRRSNAIDDVSRSSRDFAENGCRDVCVQGLTC